MRLYRILKLVFYLYVLAGCALMIDLFRQRLAFAWNSQTREALSPQKGEAVESIITRVDASAPLEVEIWGKAAISLYFWHHIFGDYLTNNDDGAMIQHGAVVIKGVRFHFKYGAGLNPHNVETTAKHIVLIANGREPSKIATASAWIRALSHMKDLKSAFIILLGNEECHNEWLAVFLQQLGGQFQNKIKSIYLVYDAVEIDNDRVHQWPLGVATYRSFPVYRYQELNVESPRRYTCNFLGTIYNDSSRSAMYKTLSDHGLTDRCYFKGRTQWLAKETEDSTSLYRHILMNSDLTLCPVGINTESYRIYEAMSVGSIPVVEDVPANKQCSAVSSSALRLLKKHHAPLIYVRNWKDIHTVIQEQSLLKHEYIVKRRIEMLEWYAKFKLAIRDNFVDNILAKAN